MNNDDVCAGIKLRDILSPELRAYSARVEVLEQNQEALGENVEEIDSKWRQDLEQRIMTEPDASVVDLLLSQANLMTAFMLHRRISNLERC